MKLLQGMLRQKEMTSPKYGAPVAAKSADHSLLGICRKIMVKDGLSGFYRGYLVSLMSNVPTSGIWWATYNCLVSYIAHVFCVHVHAIQIIHHKWLHMSHDGGR